MKEDRIKDKITEIEQFLEELESIFPFDFEEYKSDFKIRAICERNFEKIIESVVDLAFILIKERKLKIPEDDESSFNILRNENIISEVLAKKLKEAKGMRNVIAHKYGKIDDEKVFQAVSEELISDAHEFLNSIKSI
ncbi:hypothetical protein COU56_04165 [Candidatus Pacearchaeota archaeon CG10_big_fil_rev_8_21_14_0_10_31_9]|nr:MAG: hypothetical protein AUJ62_02485 [Candidatus Pacearchaeota archaeon CG1_02_32_21]PIN92685.1 MAG: hypothetical protein COU56_04165 [Candidatus Pacearchaeota archaeon CG10_big_fil_rev_8_21_14_0_10_31_9]PIZ83088.1 MAG: hypothetical protein COX97_01690 [Candidatus Pacearchaeota archaeon CG_4_10_14_0_2_um_filter_05_32_18]